MKGGNMKNKILKTAILTAVVGGLASVAIGFVSSIAFGFEAAPIIAAGSTLTAVYCAMLPIIIRANQNKDDGRK